MMKSTHHNQTPHIDRAGLILAIAIVSSIALATSWDLIYHALVIVP